MDHIKFAVFVTKFRLYFLAVAPPKQRGDTNKNCFYFGMHCRAAGMGGVRGSASFGRADAAQVCNNVATLRIPLATRHCVGADGASECSGATAARRIVSERW